MVSSKLFIALNSGAIAATLFGLAEAVVPRSGAQGSMELSMLESDAASPARYLSPCELDGQTDANPDYTVDQNVPNSTACRYRCRSEARCVWYTYNWNTKKCYLKEKTSGITKEMLPGDVTGPKICSTCEIEGMTSSSYDYRYLPNVNSPSACRQACNDDRRCAWWSYNRQAKYCYLKETKGDLISAPKDGEVTGPPICDICELVGQTARAEDYRVVENVDSVFTCRAQCRVDQRCFWYTYNFGNKKCFLKESRGTITSSVSDDVTAPAECKTCVHDQKTTTVPDYQVTENIVPDMDSCKARCKADSNCQWWTYNTHEKKCFLKAAIGGLTSSVSGDVTGAKECERCEIPEKTSDAPDIETIGGIGTAKSCQTQCQLNPSCNWYTYNKNSQKCYLKGSLGSLVGAKAAGDVTGPKTCGN